MIRGTHLYDIQTSLLICLEEARQLIGELNADAYYGYVPGKIFSGNRGRPKFNITKEQLEFMLEYKFTVPQISKMLNVSTSTIETRKTRTNVSTSTIETRKIPLPQNSFEKIETFSLILFLDVKLCILIK